jgi:hypothetical protein
MNSRPTKGNRRLPDSATPQRPDATAPPKVKGRVDTSNPLPAGSVRPGPRTPDEPDSSR